MDLSNCKKFTLKLINQTSTAYISTISENGFPEIRAMSNLRSQKDFPKLINFFSEKYKNKLTLFFSTNTSSEKLFHIKSNSKVAAYLCIPNNFWGVMLSGEMNIVENKELKKMFWHDDWITFWSKRYNDPDYSILEFTPKKAKGWNGNNIFNFEL